MEIFWEKDHNPGFFFLFPRHSFQIRAFTFHFNPREIHVLLCMMQSYSAEMESSAWWLEQWNENLRASLPCNWRGKWSLGPENGRCMRDDNFFKCSSFLLILYFMGLMYFFIFFEYGCGFHLGITSVRFLQLSLWIEHFDSVVVI